MVNRYSKHISVAEGISIVSKYYADNTSCVIIGCERDRIYLYQNEYASMTNRDIRRMKELGFFQYGLEESDAYDNSLSWILHV